MKLIDEQLVQALKTWVLKTVPPCSTEQVFEIWQALNSLVDGQEVPVEEVKDAA